MLHTPDACPGCADAACPAQWLWADAASQPAMHMENHIQLLQLHKTPCCFAACHPAGMRHEHAGMRHKHAGMRHEHAGMRHEHAGPLAHRRPSMHQASGRSTCLILLTRGCVKKHTRVTTLRAKSGGQEGEGHHLPGCTCQDSARMTSGGKSLTSALAQSHPQCVELVCACVCQCVCVCVCVCVCDCVRGSPAGPRCWLAAALRSTPSCSCCASERAHCPTVCQTCPPLAHPALLLRTRANERVLRALGAPGAPLAFAHSLAILLVHLLACSLASLLAFVDLLARLLACMLAATPTPLAQGAEPTPMTTAHMCSCQVLNLPGAAPSTCACAARPPTCTVPGARLFLCLLPRFHVAQDAQQPLRSAAQHVGQDLQAPCAMCCSARVLVILRNPSAGAQGFRAPRQCFERSSESLMPCCPSV